MRWWLLQIRNLLAIDGLLTLHWRSNIGIQELIHASSSLWQLEFLFILIKFWLPLPFRSRLIKRYMSGVHLHSGKILLSRIIIKFLFHIPSISPLVCRCRGRLSILGSLLLLLDLRTNNYGIVPFLRMGPWNCLRLAYLLGKLNIPSGSNLLILNSLNWHLKFQITLICHDIS